MDIYHGINWIAGFYGRWKSLDETKVLKISIKYDKFTRFFDKFLKVYLIDK